MNKDQLTAELKELESFLRSIESTPGWGVSGILDALTDAIDRVEGLIKHLSDESPTVPLNSMQQDVETFMKACGQEVLPYPAYTDIPEETEELREELMIEELLGKGELIDSMRKGDLVGIADGIADVLYVVLGTAAAYGINAQVAFNEAHRTNMLKAVWDNETSSWTVIRSESGKILKPEGWRPANFARAINQMRRDGMVPEGSSNG